MSVLVPIKTYKVTVNAALRPKRVLVLLALMALFAGAEQGGAAPVAPTEVQQMQSDGTPLTVRAFGDEWSNGYETADGYTVLRKGAKGDWHYATQDPSGKLVPSETVVGPATKASGPPHLRSSYKNPKQAMTGAAAEVSPTNKMNPYGFSGERKALFILVRFNNQAPVGTTPTDWRTLAFGQTGSMKDYYREVSYNKLSIVPAADNHGAKNDGIVGWVNLNYDHPNTGEFTGFQNEEITRDAILAANHYVDFSSFDTNGNGRISHRELLLIVIVAGYETAYGGPALTLSPSVWAHQSAMNTPVTVDGVELGNYDFNGGYMQFGEWHGSAFDDPGHKGTLGILCHEVGHGLNWPDLYDTDGSSEGVGRWSIMGTGIWNRKPGGFQGSSPAHPDAFSKVYQGWSYPIQFTRNHNGVRFPQAETTSHVVQLLENPDSVDWVFNRSSGYGDYFLVENRQQVGYDVGLPGAGLVVYHIDESITQYNEANSVEAHKLVDVEEADGLAQLDSHANRGDAGDPFPGTASNTVFSGSSTPSSRNYFGEETGAVLSQISVSGSVMTANVRVDGAVPTPGNDNLHSSRIINGDNSLTQSTSSGATKQSGETDHAGNAGGKSVWFSWTPTTTGTALIYTDGSSFDTLLAVYTGQQFGSLTLIAEDDDGSTDKNRSRVTFPASGGTTYRIAADGYNGASGHIVLNCDLGECEQDFGCLVDQIYKDLLHRMPSMADHNLWRNKFCYDQSTPGALAAGLASTVDYADPDGFLARCYLAIFNNNSVINYSSPDYRTPDIGGWRYWRNRVTSETLAGKTLHEAKKTVIAGFMASPEWTSRLGNTDNAGFVNFLYLNVLGRGEDNATQSYYVERLNQGQTTRRDLLLFFVESAEAVSKYQKLVHVSAGFLNLLERTTPPTAFSHFSDMLENNSATPADYFDFIITSDDYRHRLQQLGCSAN